MAVHEFGVRWPCGHARSIGDIHRSTEERARCKKCNPIEERNPDNPGPPSKRWARKRGLIEDDE